MKPITDTLRQIGHGHFVDAVSTEMSELVQAVQDTGKAGSLTITVSVKPATRGGAMVVTGKSKLRTPDEAPMEAMLFATPDGDLVADDPKQVKLDLKSVPTQQQPMKTA